MIVMRTYAGLNAKIRNIENKWGKKHDFNQYKNYYFPQQLVKNAKTMLSFGVGADLRCEKLMCFENTQLKIKLFDPTPHTISSIDYNLTKACKEIAKKRLQKRNSFSLFSLIRLMKNDKFKEQLQFFPYGYSPDNGKKTFYYDPNDENINNRIINDGTWIPESATRCFSLKQRVKGQLTVQANFKNIETIMKDLNWSQVDIIKTDIEGMAIEFGRELIEKQIKFKCWTTEVEFDIGEDQQTLKDLDKMCEDFTNLGYNIYINKVRTKPVSELIFIDN